MEFLTGPGVVILGTPKRKARQTPPPLQGVRGCSPQKESRGLGPAANGHHETPGARGGWDEHRGTRCRCVLSGQWHPRPAPPNAPSCPHLPHSVGPGSICADPIIKGVGPDPGPSVLVIFQHRTNPQGPHYTRDFDSRMAE